MSNAAVDELVGLCDSYFDEVSGPKTPSLYTLMSIEDPDARIARRWNSARLAERATTAASARPP